MITSQIASINTLSSNNPFYLPRFHKSILKFYYELRLSGYEQVAYKLPELSVRLKRDPSYISKCLAELEQWGFMGGKHNGSVAKIRWITSQGFDELDRLQPRQITNQNQSIPYIDLSDQENDVLKILEEERTCGQNQELTPEEKVDALIQMKKVSPQDAEAIKKAIRTSPIGPQRKESVIDRMFKACLNGPIMKLKSYFLVALKRELEDLRQFLIFAQKNNLSAREYDLSNLDELGCFI